MKDVGMNPASLNKHDSFGGPRKMAQNYVMNCSFQRFACRQLHLRCHNDAVRGQSSLISPSKANSRRREGSSPQACGIAAFSPHRRGRRARTVAECLQAPDIGLWIQWLRKDGGVQAPGRLPRTSPLSGTRLHFKGGPNGFYPLLFSTLLQTCIVCFYPDTF